MRADANSFDVTVTCDLDEGKSWPAAGFSVELKASQGSGDCSDSDTQSADIAVVTRPELTLKPFDDRVCAASSDKDVVFEVETTEGGDISFDVATSTADVSCGVSGDNPRAASESGGPARAWPQAPAARPLAGPECQACCRHCDCCAGSIAGLLCFAGHA